MLKWQNYQQMVTRYQDGIIVTFRQEANFRTVIHYWQRITPCLENSKGALFDCLPHNETGWGSTEFIVLRPKLSLPPYFGYLLARRPEFRAFAIQSMSGTSGRQRVQVDRLAQYTIVLPNDVRILQTFGVVIEPLVAKITAGGHETKVLSQLRDMLLPKLLSGEMRIKK